MGKASVFAQLGDVAGRLTGCVGTGEPRQFDGTDDAKWHAGSLSNGRPRMFAGAVVLVRGGSATRHACYRIEDRTPPRPL
jgi:hypothetical protein